MKTIKLMSFNSDHLAFVDLCKAMIIVIRRISYGVDSLAYAQLLPLCSFPFGGELAAFARGADNWCCHSVVELLHAAQSRGQKTRGMHRIYYAACRHD